MVMTKRFVIDLYKNFDFVYNFKSFIELETLIIYLNKNYIKGMQGELETIMAGLNCGTPSEHGWRILKGSADAFLSCEDQITVIGMKCLYFPSGKFLDFLNKFHSID